MKRVALLVHSSEWSSYEQSLYELLIRWNRHPTPIVYMIEEGMLSGKLREQGILVRIEAWDGESRGRGQRDNQIHKQRANRLSPRLLQYARRLSEAFKLDQIECVHLSINSLHTAVYGSLAAKLASVPLVWYIEKIVTIPNSSWISARMMRTAARYIPDGIMVSSLSTLSSLKLPLKLMDHAQLVYPGYSGLYGRSNEICPDPAYITILLVGRLTEWKGQHLLLAVARVFLTDHRVRFWLTGAEQHEDQIFREMLEHQIRMNGLKNITLLGAVDNLQSVIQQADILLYTNVSPEPINQVILQAMAAGIPIIASNIGGQKEIIRDGESGVLYPPGDIGALRRSIRWMVNHPEEREEMGLKGLQRVKNHFAIEVSLQRILDYYE